VKGAAGKPPPLPNPLNAACAGTSWDSVVAFVEPEIELDGSVEVPVASVGLDFGVDGTPKENGDEDTLELSSAPVKLEKAVGLGLGEALLGLLTPKLNLRVAGALVPEVAGAAVTDCVLWGVAETPNTDAGFAGSPPVGVAGFVNKERPPPKPEVAL